jgi:hypothetical protein
MATKKKPEPKKAPAKKPAAKKAVPKKRAVKALPVEKIVAEVVEDKPGRGRPSSYRPEFAEQAYKLCLLYREADDALTDKKLADFFGVAVSTIYLWKNERAEFSEALARGKDLADAEIAHSLFQRAKGYEHPEDDIRTVSMGMNAGSEIVITPTIKRYPPDTGAAALWLSNRQPGRWRTKVEVEHGITDNVADILMAGRKRIAKPIEQ